MMWWSNLDSHICIWKKNAPRTSVVTTYGAVVISGAKHQQNQFAPSIMVADAVAIEPVSASKLPANREKNREFFDFGSVLRIRELISPTVSGAFERIPYSSEEGIFPTEQGSASKE
jgi:hypothetical protein